MESLLVIFALLAGGGAIIAGVAWRKAETRAVQNDNRIIELQAQLKSEIANCATTAEQAQKNERQWREANETLNTKITQAAAQIAELKTELKNAQKGADEKIALLQEVRESMGAEFKNLSQNILEEKGKKFDENSQKLLTPLRDNLQEFRQRVDAIHSEQTREQATLKSEIEGLQKNTAQVSKEANTLALALKGDSKTQGDWGEVALVTLLEKSGLRKGEEYETQEAMRGEEGNILRPDVVIKLPENKHLIIDSKVSLRDYHDASAAADDNAYKISLARHVTAVKNHVSGLAEKHYARAQNVNTLDFVFMFMPVEPAFFAALKESPSLFLDAYNKNIILCAPTTLMATLRMVERLWRLERQNHNAQEIAEQGGKLYDKFATFLESMKEIDNALDKARASYDKAYKQIEAGNGNLIGQVEKLRKLGVNPRKRLPARESEDEENING